MQKKVEHKTWSCKPKTAKYHRAGDRYLIQVGSVRVWKHSVQPGGGKNP